MKARPSLGPSTGGRAGGRKSPLLVRSDEGWESFAFKDSLKLDVPKWSFNVFITHVKAR